MVTSRAAAAVERGLEARQREVANEVERILSSAVHVIERVAPASPRLSDIISAAGSSNAAFYRYFSSKDDLLLAVMERGVGLVVSYLRHEMAKESTLEGQISRWIRGSLAQVADVRLAKVSRAVITQLPSQAEFEVTDPLRVLLVEPVSDLGSAAPERDAQAIYGSVMDAVRRHLAFATVPDDEEADHLVTFCLNAITPPVC